MAHPYRADHVGSQLRPPDLVHARQDFNQGRISGEQLREVEDRAVLQALDLQRQVGVENGSASLGGRVPRRRWSCSA